MQGSASVGYCQQQRQGAKLRYRCSYTECVDQGGRGSEIVRHQTSLRRAPMINDPQLLQHHRLCAALQIQGGRRNFANPLLTHGLR